MPELLILGHNAITQASFTTVCLYIWFNTNAFVEYLNIIDKSLGKFTKERNETLEKYYKQKELSPSITYPEFLAVEYNNFFTELTFFQGSVLYLVCLYLIWDISHYTCTPACE